jgi:hypothetical protein
MLESFQLLDLVSQAAALQRLLKGTTAAEKIVWLAERGDLFPIRTKFPNTPPTYRFVSTIGLECVFFIDGDEFVFVGSTTFTGMDFVPPI